MLLKPLKNLSGLGDVKKLSTCTMDTPVIEVIHLLTENSVSSIPIVDGQGKLINVYEAVDILALVKRRNVHRLGFICWRCFVEKAGGV